MEIEEIDPGDDSDAQSEFAIRQRKLPEISTDSESPSIRDWVSKNIMLRAAFKPAVGQAEVLIQPTSDALNEREPIETFEPRMFKGMCYQDFNDYLYNNGRNPDAYSLIQRLRERDGESGTSATPGGSPRSPSSPGLEVVQEEGNSNLSIFEIAKNLIGQVHRCREFTSPQHFMLIIIEETDSVLKRMLGKLTSRSWKEFEASDDIRDTIQNLADVYLDAFKFLPRHCYMTCDDQLDPLDCCWERKFGSLVLGNDNALRLVRLTNMYRIELTRAICIFLRRIRRKVADFPDHVHLVMEEWMASAFDDEIALLPRRRTYEQNDNCSLAEKTGLLPDQIVTYKTRYRDKKYSFETKRDEHRIQTEIEDDREEWRRTSGMTKYAVIVPYIKQYPDMRFEDFTPQFQTLVWWKVGMFASLSFAHDKRMNMWYNRVRRAELQKPDRMRAGLPLYS